MPITTIRSSDLTPTYVAKPNQRFATTFLSNKYRDYAIMGESIMDKATGEIFTKRPIDGKVVSFFQNKKYTHDMLMELRVLLNNTSEFYYPIATENSAAYLATDYDVMSLHEEKEFSIEGENTVFTNLDDKPLTQLRFNLAGHTNGFFVRITTRDADKAALNWLIYQYNHFFANYTGTEDSEYVNEKVKFDTIEKWADSSCAIHYNVTIIGEETNKTYSSTDFVKLNEQMCVLLPMPLIENDFPNGYIRAEVEISSISYGKIQFMLKHQDDFGDAFKNKLKELRCPDNNFFTRYISIFHFVNSMDDIVLHGNESVVALLDVPYVYRYMMKMSKLKERSEVVFSPQRPTPDIWGTNSIWIEDIREVGEYGRTINRNSEIDIKALEEYLANDLDYMLLDISENEFEKENIYEFQPDTTHYSDVEVDRKLNQLYNYIDKKAGNVISSISDKYAEVNGMVVEPVKIVDQTPKTDEEGEE